MNIYNPLQLREIFHIEFLRWLGRRLKAQKYALKGGVNLRLFFKSFRYSEDIDLDLHNIGVNVIKEEVMGILESDSFLNSLRAFGIERIAAPDMAKAKQTETTQRFKVHLITYSQEDLFTKIEFSRRGFSGDTAVEPALDNVLREYKLTPLLVPHYTIQSAVAQKISALASRSVIQARDIFDLYILIPQCGSEAVNLLDIDNTKLKKAYENTFEINFRQFKDTVISYLAAEDQGTYNSGNVWDNIRLKVGNFIEQLNKKNGKA